MTNSTFGPGTGGDEGLAGALGLTGDERGGIDLSGSGSSGETSHDADIDAGYDSDDDGTDIVDGTVS